tara:strand:- start:415 stop:561 length:147 start_codon:yes stop_codon:yes gene_type:complete
MNKYDFTNDQMEVLWVMITYFRELGINPKHQKKFNSLVDYMQTGGDLF